MQFYHNVNILDIIHSKRYTYLSMWLEKAELQLKLTNTRLKNKHYTIIVYYLFYFFFKHEGAFISCTANVDQILVKITG